MSADRAKGTTYWCPVCRAEVTVTAPCHGEFRPRCCNRPMEPRAERSPFYVCPVCKAEIVVIAGGGTDFHPRCCNVAMILEAA